MLDIHFIRENPELVKQGARKKRIAVDIDRLLEVDEKRRHLKTEVDELRRRRNQLAQTSRSAKKEEAVLEKARLLKLRIGKAEQLLRSTEADFKRLMLMVPNVPDADIPEGDKEADNKVIRRWGKKKRFSFPVRDHVALGEALGIVDFQRAGRTSGSGFYYLKNEGAVLEWALLRFALDHLRKRNFTLMTVPTLVREPALIGTGFFPREEGEVYLIDRDRLFLVGTAEIPLGAYYQDSILEEKDLPKMMAGLSVCYRREAGAHGADTRGLFRVHQFNKVEMFLIVKPENSRQFHEELVRIAEELLQKLGLPYQVVLNCTGDLGVPQSRKYDIQTWLPARDLFGETHSASNDTDFQARRLKIRYREVKSGEVRFVHTLNNTALASPRILIPLLEFYQKKDGGVEVPAVLRPYTGFSEIKPDRSVAAPLPEAF